MASRNSRWLADQLARSAMSPVSANPTDLRIEQGCVQGQLILAKIENAQRIHVDAHQGTRIGGQADGEAGQKNDADGFGQFQDHGQTRR